MKIILAIAIFVCVQGQMIEAQTASELLQRAKASIQAGKNEAAVQDLNEIIKTDASNAEAFAQRAHAYIRLRNYASSLTDSSRATAISPNFGWAYYLHGIASYWQANKDFKGALADFTKVIVLDPKLAAESYRYRADIHNQFDKDYWAAVADANEAVRLDPKDGNAYAQRGWANSQLKNYEKARDDYRLAIKNNFATSEAYKTLGFVEVQLKDYDQAVIDTRKALELDPNNQDAKLNLTNILAWQEEQKKKSSALFAGPKTPEEKAAFDEIMKFLNDAEDEKHAEAKELLDKGDYAGVLAYLKIDRIGFFDSKSWELRAAAYFKLQKYDEALKEMSASFSSTMKAEASQYLLRGDIYKAKYDFVSAEKDYRKALELAPNDASIKQKLSSLNITAPKPAGNTTASIAPKKPAASAQEEDAFLKEDPSAKAAYSFWDLNDFEKVYDNATSSIKVKPTSKMYQLRAEAILNLIDDDPMLYDYEGALKDINAAIELSSRNMGGKYLTRGDIYVGMKDLPKALENYTKSIDVNPNSYPPFLERGKIYMMKGFEDWAKAVADFGKVVALDSTNSDAYNARGYAYFRLDKKAESAADFKKALAINPKDAYAKYNVDALAENRRVLSREEHEKLRKVYYV